MSTVEEESDTVTVETVNSVTLTQDTEGNLILHCPQNGIELHCIVFFFLLCFDWSDHHTSLPTNSVSYSGSAYCARIVLLWLKE